MQVTRGTVVSLNYTLRDDDGQVIEKTEEPFDYLHGYNRIIPGLEKALEGAEPGHQEEIVVEPADAYGERDEGAVFSVPAENVLEGAEVWPGMQVIGDTPGGPVMLTVREVNEDDIMVDANHPLAGMRLHFDVEVLGVRAASDDELAGCSDPDL